MDIRVLGPLEVVDGAKPVALGGPKKRAVLATVVVHANTVVSADRLIDEIWGEDPPASARRTLHSYVSSLRKALNIHGEILSGRQGGYLLDVDASAIDAERFSRNIELARTLRSSDSVEALRLLNETLALWRGPPFGSLAGDIPSLQIESTRLEELRLVALELQIDCEFDLGREGMAIGDLERLVLEHPYREGLWHRLMVALYRSGRQGEALAAFQRIRRILIEELGIEPSRRLTQLEDQILLHDPALDAVLDASGDCYEIRPPAFLSGALPSHGPIHRVFVERENELARLDDFLNQALKGDGSPVFVTGEAGTGKTALVTEFISRAQQAHSELVVVGGTCEALTGIGDPYLPFRETMSLLTGDCERRWAAGTISRDQALRLWGLLPTVVQAICDSGPTLLNSIIPGRDLACRTRAFGADGAQALARLEELLSVQVQQGSPSPPGQNQTFAEYAAVLDAAASHHPLVVVIEDLHWADTSSVQLFSYLSRHLDGRRILLIGTSRPEDVAQGRGGTPHPLTAVLTDIKQRLGDTFVDLDRIEANEGRSFVDALVDTEPNDLRESFREQLTEHSGGRALFAVELLGHVRAQGDLGKDEEGRWVEKGIISWQTLPARVEGVIERLIARLDPELRDALLVAAVEGVEFTAEVIAAVQDIDDSVLIRRLSEEVGHKDRLVEARGVIRTETQRLSRYRFRHSLFQKFLYDSLDPVERSNLHEEVGNALETLHAPHTGEVAAQLASHFQNAGADNKAGRYLQQAGDRSLRLSANTEAIGYYTEALRVLENQPDTTERDRRELTMVINLSLPLERTLGYWADEVETVFERARVLGEQQGATPELFAALRGLWHCHHSRLELDKAGELANQLLRLANIDGGDPVLIVQAHRIFGEDAFFRGNFVQAREHLEQAIDTYDPVAHRSHPYPGILDPGIISGLNAATSLWILGYPDRAVKSMAETLELARKWPRSDSFVVALGVAGRLHKYRREDEMALRLADEKIKVASETEFKIHIAIASFARGEALVDLGAVEEGMNLMKEGLEVYRGAFLPWSLTVLAEAYEKAGQASEGLSAVAEALDLVDKVGGYFTESELWRVKGELELLTGDESEASNSFSTAMDTARRQGARSFELRAVTSMARLLQRQGRDREAFEMLTEIYEWFTEGFETGDLREARELLDQLSTWSR
jgi:DNA-binding SARP family transcriptional activator